MSKGGLKQTEFEFTIQVGAISQIKTKQPAKFYLTWKIIHDNQGKEIVGDQYLHPNKNGVLGFSTEMKAFVKIIFNKDTNTYIKKKSMLCLNYIDDSNPNQSKLAGLVTIDLSTLISKNNSGFQQHILQRSPFKKSTVTLKIVFKKLKEQMINSFDWESKQLSIDSLFDKSNDKSSTCKKKINQPRKNLTKSVQGLFNEERKVITQNYDEPIKQLLERQKYQNLIRQLKHENQDLLNKIQTIQKQNNQYKQNAEHNPSTQRLKTLEQQLAQIEDEPQQQTQSVDYQMMVLQNQNILNQMQRLSKLLDNKQKQLATMKQQNQKLRKKDKKKSKDNNPQLQQQLGYLSQQVMRLHEQLANHRQTQVQNIQLTKLQQQLQSKLNLYQIELDNKDVQLKKQEFIINDIKSQLQKKQESTIDFTESSISFNSRHEESVFSTCSISKPKKQGLSDITSKTSSNTNIKVKDSGLSDIQKLKNLSLNGMTSQNKKSFNQILKRLQSKLQETLH